MQNRVEYLSTTIDLQPALNWLAEENLKRPITERLLYDALLLKAVALALREVPELNSVFYERTACCLGPRRMPWRWASGAA